MHNLKRTLVIFGVMFLLEACAGRVTSEVTRFHEASPPAGEAIAIIPLDDTKRGSLEFSSYAKLVASKLTAIGYHVVDATANPDLLAKMDYSVGDAQTKFKNWPDSYVHYHYNLGRHYPYYYGRYWDEPYVYSYTVYPRKMDVIISRKNGDNVFEGHVKSIGRESNLNQVVAYMVSALFHNFPGESGITKVVTIQKDGYKEPY